ncbi:MAG: hypothetical protein EOM52_09865 [Clostridia bacterium]|nr:hypothetical protein [Clostridia bacterium]
MNFIQRMMYGRYGGDQLSICLLGLYVILYLVSLLTHIAFFYVLGILLILWAFFRMFSRNLEKRRGENQRFLTMMSPMIRWCKLHRAIRRDKDHRYFKCPNCGQQLRVPRGKGKVTVSCRNCGVSFEEKS